MPEGTDIYALIELNIDRIYEYARRHTYASDEAQELAQGREKIRKDWDSDMNDTVISPIKLHIGIVGSGDYGGNIPFPGKYISDALSRNILWHCKSEAKTVEELSTLTGVPAFYIEQSMENLIEREAVRKISNKYITDFIVFTKDICRRINDRAVKLSESIYERVYAAFASLGGDTLLLTAMTSTKIFDSLYPPDEIKRINSTLWRKRYDGGYWQYRAHEPGAREISITHMSGGGGTFAYSTRRYDIEPTVYKLHDLLYDHEVCVCEKIIYGAQDGFSEKEKETAASLIERGYLKEADDGRLEVAIPYFKKDQADAISKAALEAFMPLADEYRALCDKLSAFCLEALPEHVRGDFSGTKCGMLLPACMKLALDKGLLTKPEHKYCEYLIQRSYPKAQ